VRKVFFVVTKDNIYIERVFEREEVIWPRIKFPMKFPQRKIPNGSIPAYAKTERGRKN